MQLISMANMHIFGLWEEPGVPGGNQPRHMENMQTPHRKAPGDEGVKARTLLLRGSGANRHRAHPSVQRGK